MYKKLLLFIIFISTLYAEILILKKQDSYDIIPEIKVYKNSNIDLNINTVLTDKNNWREDKEKYLNLGYGKEDNWLKFDVINVHDDKYFIEFKLATIDLLDVYITKDEKIVESYKTGINRPFFSRPLNSNKFVIPLSLLKNQKYTIFIKVNSSFKPKIFSFKIFSDKKLSNNLFSLNIIDGIVIGILIVMFFYNFLIYFYTNYKAYKSYLLYIFSVILVNITGLGYGYMYLYPANILLNKIMITISLGLLPISMILFIRDILEIELKSKTYQRLKYLLFTIILIIIGQIIMLIFNLSYTNLLYMIGTIFSWIIFLSLTLVILYKLIKGNKLAKFLFIAWIFPLFSSMIYIINRFYFFIDIDTINLIVQISFVIELTLMSIIIGYRLSTIEAQKQNLLIENQQKELEILRNSKLASMGELLQHITHQWKQPLMRINTLLLDMDTKFSQDIEVNKKLDHYLDAIEKETIYMGNTITTFSQYFYPNKEKCLINLYQVLNELININQDILTKLNIKIKIICENTNIVTQGYKEEYIQVLSILLNNAQDSLCDENIKNKEITCLIGKKDNIPFISIENIGIQIKEEDLDNIFKPYFSTKNSKKNSGLGLYIAKMLVEDSMNKKIKITNTQNGVKFIIVG